MHHGDDSGSRQPQRDSEPAINLPPVTLALIVINVLLHVAQALMPIELEAELVLPFAFVPVRYTVDMDAVGGSEIATLLAPVAFQFIHAGWLHLGINCVTLGAFGAPLERLLGGRRFLGLYLVCGAVSAFGHLLADPASPQPLVGASGGIAGLLGALMMVIGWRRGLRWLVPVIAVLIVMQIVIGLTGMPGTEGAEIAWVAHVAGLLAGLVLIHFFAPRRSAGS